MDSQYLRITQTQSISLWNTRGKPITIESQKELLKKNDLQNQRLQNLGYHITDYKITMHKMFKLVKKKWANTKPTKNHQVNLEKSQVTSRTSKNLKNYKNKKLN